MTLAPSTPADSRLPQVFHRPRCPFCRRIRAYLTEKDIPIELVDFVPEQHESRLRELNPKLQVPTYLTEDGLALYESFVIMQYVEDIEPEPSLLPDNAADRARMRLLFDLADSRITPAMIQFIRSPKDHPRRSEHHDELVEYIAESERFLAPNAFYALECGFTMADLSVPPIVFRAIEAGLDPTRLPDRVRRWAHAVLSRPSSSELYPGVSIS